MKFLVTATRLVTAYMRIEAPDDEAARKFYASPEGKARLVEQSGEWRLTGVKSIPQLKKMHVKVDGRGVQEEAP